MITRVSCILILNQHAEQTLDKGLKIMALTEKKVNKQRAPERAVVQNGVPSLQNGDSS